MVTLRSDQPVEQVEQIVGNAVIEEKRAVERHLLSLVTQDNEEAPVPRARKPTTWTHG